MAASSGKFEIIKLLHANKIDLHAQDNNGENSIHYCCRSNNVDAAKQIVEYLVSNGVSLDIQNKNGETALHIAARYGCSEIVRYLCDKGAHLDLQDDEGETALIIASARGYVDSVKTLIEHKADLNIRDKRGNIALHWAVKRHYTVIALLLIQAGCNIDAIDANGETALHIACRENLLTVVQTMCALGCRVDIKNKQEMTPLHTATEKNEIDAVRCLCLAGLDLNITNKDGLTAEQLAISLKHTNIANLLSSLRRKRCSLFLYNELNTINCYKYRQENREIYIEQLVPTEEPLRSIKIKIFGSSGVGKSTLIDSLKCSYLGSFFRRTRLGSKSGKNRGSIRRTSVDGQIIEAPKKAKAILDNYEVTNEPYTRGIDITTATLNGTHHYSIWEFSGYEPYQVFYDHFIGDHNCIHLIVYSLEKTQSECCDEIVYWLEFLRARIPPKEQILHKGKCSNSVKIILVGTHADLDKQAYKNDNNELTSEKADEIFRYIYDLYQFEFDINEKHFVMNARAAWVPDMKLLMQTLNQLKEGICERLPHCTMFLSRTLHNINNLRKAYTSYPIIEWKKFIELIREKVNPLASDEHFREVVQQLQLMGEVIYLEGDPDQHLICYNPEWLCHQILGTLLSHERFRTKKINGYYTLDELEHMFSDTCSDIKNLKEILIALDLCTEHEKEGGIVYEFPSLNLIETVNRVWDRQLQSGGAYVYNGLQIRCSSRVKTLLGCLFPRIQVHIGYLSTEAYECAQQNQTTQLTRQDSQIVTNLLLSPSNLVKTYDNISNGGGGGSSGDESTDAFSNTFLSLASNKLNNTKQSSGVLVNGATTLGHKYGHTLYNIDLRQWRYGTKINRQISNLECLLTIDPEGLYIELKARAPASKREELFYFVQDLHSLIEQTILESCPGLNLEMHYLSPTILSRHLACTSTYAPKTINQMQIERRTVLINSNNDKEKFMDVICCGSDLIYKNLILGVDLPISQAFSLYTRRMLYRLLDDVDPMGRDWCLLAVILGFQERLPKFDNLPKNVSKTGFLLDEWAKVKPNATVRTLIEKLTELGRKDVVDLVLNTSTIFKINIPDDSGILNSNQTLSSK